MFIIDDRYVLYYYYIKLLLCAIYYSFTLSTKVSVYMHALTPVPAVQRRCGDTLKKETFLPKKVLFVIQFNTLTQS
jgi:hypothetical protein